MDLRFEWDPTKDAANQKKHGVSFAEAQSVFYDERGLLEADPDESPGETRFILLGMSSSLRLLVVCHCERAAGNLLRLISARKATKSEQKQYWARIKK